MIRPLATTIPFALLLTSSLSAANQVLVVDAGGGGGFTDIQSAVDAATDGDLVLIRPGSYGWIDVNQKDLTLIGDPLGGARPTLRQVKVRNLLASQKVVVRGLDMTANLYFNLQIPGEFANNAGAVLIEDCSFAVQPTIEVPTPTDAVYVDGCARHVMTRCTITGLMGDALYSSEGSPGLIAKDSSVSLYQCVVTGGNGGDAKGTSFTLSPAHPGEPAVRMENAFLLLGGCALRGGEGGDGRFAPTAGCADPEDGGAGLVQDGPLKLFATTLTGGAAGATAAGCSQSASPGAAREVVSGALEDLNEPLHALEVTSPARAGQPTTLTLNGSPGQPALLLVSSSAQGEYFAGVKGTLVGDAPFVPIGLGVLPASGRITLSPITGNLPAAISGADAYLQFVAPGAWGLGFLSSPSVVAVLSAGL